MDGKQKAIIVIIVLIVAGLGSFTVLFKTQFHHQHLGSEVTHAILRIDNLHDTNFSLQFDNTTDLLYSIDVETYSGVPSYGPFTYDDGLDPQYPHIRITCDAMIKSMNITLRSDVDFFIDINSVGNVDAHITYSNNVTISESKCLSFTCVGNSSNVILEVYEDCFVTEDEVSFEVIMNYPSEASLFVDLPQGWDGSYYYSLDEPPTILALDGWSYWPTNDRYATFPFPSPDPDKLMGFLIRSSQTFIALYD